MKKSLERPIDRALRWAKDMGMNQTQFAKAMGVSDGRLTNWKRRGMPPELHAKAAIVTGHSVDELVGLVSEGGAKTSAGRVGARLERVPVIGTAQLDQEGFWNECLETPAQTGGGYIEMPSRDLKAYAVRVIGDAMHPRIKSGEYVVVEPGHPYASGDEVLITLKDGRTMVREFLFEREGQLALLAINPGQARLTLALDSVESVHYVKAIARSAVFD